MRNVLAIAHKELRSYFASPIAYIVIGCFAALYGFFFSFILEAFIRQAMQAGMMGGAQPLNVNQQVIRPVFQNVTVIALFLLPMVTMRTYSEEKRSGTIELLLTSPITDVQIVRPSEIESFTRAAVNAITGSNPTEPLPPEYPDEKALFTVTFYYNEQPP